MPVYATYRIKGWPSEEVSFNYRLSVHSCPVCHITYALPEQQVQRMERYNSAEYPRNTASAYCPNGHEWHFTGRTPDQAARLRAERDRDRYIDLLNAEKRSHAATKGTLTKARRRADAGVCPHCSRTFKQVQRHIASQHPDAGVAA